jgi:ketosteroid isomerase-like protein
MRARPRVREARRHDRQDLVTDMLHASDVGDWERFRALLAADCEWVNPVVRAEGADAIAENVAGFMSAFGRRRHHVSLLLESGEFVAVEGEWAATDESGRAVRAPFAAITRVDDGHVAAVRLYVDTAALMAQLAPVESAA